MTPPKSKSKLQPEEGLQAARAAKLSRESGEGTSSAVRTDDVGDTCSYLSQLIAMHEDALDTDDETVDPFSSFCCTVTVARKCYSVG